jgi:hypothetical protein
MHIDRDTLRAEYEGLSDERLAEIGASEDYSELARTTARELLANRTRREASAPREAEQAPEADAVITASAPRKSPPSRAALLLFAVPMLVLSVAGMWLRARERDRTRQELERLSREPYETPADEVDPETAALAEAAARGEVVLTVDREGHVVATPIAPDAGR